MPQQVYRKELGFSSYLGAPEPEQLDPSSGEMWRSAFKQSNAVWNFLDFTTQPEFKPDPTFKLAEKVKENGYWDNNRDDFIGVQSEDEFIFTAAQIERQRKERETLARSGWAGVAASMVAGAVDPTIMLPLTAGGRGARAVVEGAAIGFATAAGEEAILFANQPERTGTEAAIGIGTATVLGGILGGASTYLTRPAKEIALDTDNLFSSTSLTPAGAAVSRESAGGLKPGAPSFISRIGPVTSTIDQDVSPQAQWMMGQMADAGLRREKNIEGVPSALGGTVEDRIKTWYAPVKTVINTLDEQYGKYWFGDSSSRLLGDMRAAVGGHMRVQNGKLSKQEFKQEIAKALFSGDTHATPEVEAVAQAIRKEIFDPLLEEAQRPEVKLISADATPTGDVSYLNRDYDVDMIARRFDEFVSILSRNFDKKLGEEFQKKLAKLRGQVERDTERVQDINLPEDEAVAQRQKIVEELKATEEGRAADIMEVEDQIAELRAAAKNANGDAKKGLLEQARGLERGAGEPLRNLRDTRAGLRRRLANLNRNRYVFEQKLKGKLAKIDAAEEASFRTLERLVRSGRRLLDKLDTLTDEQLDVEIAKLEQQFNNVSATLDKTEARLSQAVEGDNDELVEKLFYKAVEKNDRLDRIFEQIEVAQGSDREGLRALVQGALDESIVRVQDIVARRAERVVRLREGADRLDPKLVDAEVRRIEKRIEDRRGALRESTRELGGENVDVVEGTAEFGAFAKERAQTVAHKILGTELRLPGIDILQGERGPELARLLDIPSSELADFLNLDVEQLIRKHVRTLAPDIELSRKFGSPNAVEEFRKLTDEYNNAVDAISAKGLEGKAKDAALTKLNKQYTEYRTNLEAVIGRLRHTWGIPRDPRGAAVRLARVAMNLNVARLMGGVTISSVADISRPIQKYGLLNTFRDGFVPLVTNLKAFKMSAKEAQLGGTALDVVLHTRAHQMFDVLDEFGRGTKAERLLEYATSRIGLLGLFDYWTSGMKQFTAVVANAKLLRSIKGVVEGGANAKDIEFLASVGIDGPAAEKIWKQVQGEGGGGQVNGMWLPNTEAWKDADATRAYRAALVGEIDDTIITPGAERPLWVDKTTLGRVIAQFRSFGLSSTTKTLMAGMQQTSWRDREFVHGTMASLGLGAVSYYLWAVAVGGEAYTEMLNAGLDKWADEAINRSGNLGVLSDAQRIFENIPITQKSDTRGWRVPVNFSGTRSSRREGGDLVSSIMGPSYDLAERSANVVMGLDQPTQSTLHQFRSTLPYQNLFWLRRALDHIEKSSGLPERRQ